MIDGTEDMDLPLCFVCHGAGKLWCRPSQAWPDDGGNEPAPPAPQVYPCGQCDGTGRKRLPMAYGQNDDPAQMFEACATPTSA